MVKGDGAMNHIEESIENQPFDIAKMTGVPRSTIYVKANEVNRTLCLFGNVEIAG